MIQFDKILVHFNLNFEKLIIHIHLYLKTQFEYILMNDLYLFH